MKFLAASAITASLLAATPQIAYALTVSGTLYEDSAETTCNGQTACALSFSVAPTITAEKNIRITELGCDMNMSQSVIRLRMFVTDQGDNVRRFHYLEPRNKTGRYTFREPVDYIFTGGPPRQLAIQFDTAAASATFSVNCTVVGSIIPR